ncbi:MAG: DUF3127 domain-containing protein [Bacteroidales bacterium]|nr:DUF3127 domain-containing protein [Bacteroidales bacterium]
MSFETSGRITEIFQTQQVTDKFKKREFVIEIKETGNAGFEFVEYVKFQTVQDKCSMLDAFNIDDNVRVSFNLRGRKWEKDGQTSYFINLDAWKIENEQSTNNSPSATGSQDQDRSDNFSSDITPGEPPADSSGFDDLPF